MRVVLLLCFIAPVFCYYENTGEYNIQSPYALLEKLRAESRYRELPQYRDHQPQYRDHLLGESRGESQYREHPHYGHQLSDQDVANVMRLVQSVSNQLEQDVLRTGEPIAIKVEPVSNTDSLRLEIEGDLVDKLPLSFPRNPVKPKSNTLRQLLWYPSTLKQAGINDIVLPGDGPAIELSIEGPLAERIKNMKLSELQLPHEMLSSIYQQRVNTRRGEDPPKDLWNKVWRPPGK